MELEALFKMQILGLHQVLCEYPQSTYINNFQVLVYT